MTETACPPGFLPVAAPDPRTEDTRTGPPPRRLRGPVLMGDLFAAPGGRPLLLTHWDPPDDPR
jgi:hypothetical protein